LAWYTRESVKRLVERRAQRRRVDAQAANDLGGFGRLQQRRGQVLELDLRLLPRPRQLLCRNHRAARRPGQEVEFHTRGTARPPFRRGWQGGLSVPKSPKGMGSDGGPVSSRRVTCWRSRNAGEDRKADSGS